MKWLKKLGWIFAVVVILFGLFSLVGSVVVSYKQTGQPPGDPGPTLIQVVEQGYLKMLGRLPTGAELQAIVQKINSGKVTNGDQLRETIWSLNP